MGTVRESDWVVGCLNLTRLARRCGGVIVGVCCFLSVAALAAGTSQPARPEYEVKAAFLLKIPSFVDWPTNVFLLAESHLAIGIIGKDPFGQVLDQLAQQKTSHGRRFTVHRCADVDEAIEKKCHLVFVSSSEKDRVERIVQRLRGKPVLTIGDTPGFCERGIVINLVVIDKRVRFEINVETARDAGLKISSQLLDLGIRIADRRASDKSQP